MLKYKVIADDIRSKIQAGEYAAEALLPDQVALALHYEVSRMTVKKAIDILAMEGLVYRKRGMGTRVLKNALWNQNDSLALDYQGLTAQMKGTAITNDIIEFNIQFPDEALQNLLMIGANEAVYYVHRVRNVDGKPYVMEYTYFVASLVHDLTPAILEQSIYDYIKADIGLVIGGAYRKIHADVASDDDCQYLACEATTPVLEVEQVVYQKNGTPFEYSRSRNRFDTRSYTITDIIKD
ncbi:GntR family transcriptional regulator [Brochothrix campestris]|uniref:GntR family transcriptional regulator n=1 Tax=Brochothrix campestris FSL F6-1037 TaxID=1265861 RepID=W7CJ59_9LIST|nr:GntR family transcriptional regulator [Brochothrix campestris]EUJ39409.1 GntR family transcriptional regulator [Brochothrix campestris FSL F6-1037]